MYTIYTDGACEPNPGRAGYAAIIYKSGYPSVVSIISNGIRLSTNNRAELLAVIKALETIPNNSDCLVYSDSSYVVKGITDWVWKWSKNGWKNSTGSDVKNRDLWENLVFEFNRQDLVKFKWVKGHSKDIHNNEVDKIAVACIKNKTLLEDVGYTGLK